MTLLQEAWNALQAVPSYIETQAALFASEEVYIIPVADVPGPHSPDMPFCTTPECPCHFDLSLIDETVDYVQDGLLTAAEANRLFQGRQL